MTMSKEKKPTEPSQLPEITWREPTKQYGYFDVKVPIAWKDFMGVEKVKSIATATLNIVDAIKAEYADRAQAEKQADIEARAEAKAKADAKKQEEKGAAIQKIIEDEPDLVMAKRKELGVDVINDEAAAAIIHQERQAPPKKPADPPKSAATKSAPSEPVDTGGYEPAPLPDGDFGETVRFYKGDYGWSAYLDKGKEDDMIPILFDWLVAIPMENRHRRGTKYPCISHSGKYLMVNDFEKAFITTAAEAKGMKISIKED
jgi:hypothetical protein